ncbi:ribosomal L7Ae/L30e/S12e/Gadd45 family protein [Candidatus Woesearchaeota archaeon]|nr:ribosomal L7Ae/L30e/S12e/Gadd45 family protein [Candidatus Woesearchaeota archaeon]
MAKPSDESGEIKKLLDAGKLVVGTDRTMKHLKNGSAKKVFLSKNVSQETHADVERYARLGGVDVVHAQLTSDEFGALCRRPFGISVLSVAKE